ncbi:MAG: hypothetical protein KJO06_02055 [Gemmatimonadetes bacterium]|nr:hypothetical protein [Gemmatimonadota bacterium]
MATALKGTLAGYAALGVTYMAGALLAWALIGPPAFGPEGLAMPWVVALLPVAMIAGLAGGGVCRRVTEDRRGVAALVGILLGLVVLVLLVDLLIGPTASAREFLERLSGRTLANLPFAELWEGRPQAWFTLASYGLAVTGVVAGARLRSRRTSSAPA